MIWAQTLLLEYMFVILSGSCEVGVTAGAHMHNEAKPLEILVLPSSGVHGAFGTIHPYYYSNW